MLQILGRVVVVVRGDFEEIREIGVYGVVDSWVLGKSVVKRDLMHEGVKSKEGDIVRRAKLRSLRRG